MSSSPQYLSSEEDIDNFLAELYSASETENSLGIISRTPEIEINDLEIKQSLNLLSQSAQGGTGGVVWQTTPKFAKWILNCEITDLVINQTVIELGSGTGCLANLLSPHVNRFICTDQKAVLKLCKSNTQSLANVEIHEFDWEEHVFTPPISTKTVVIACDTVYNEYLINPFIEAISSLLTNPNIDFALVNVQLREFSILHVFLTQLIASFEVCCYSIENGFICIQITLNSK